jgi:hypothetical protein
MAQPRDQSPTLRALAERLLNTIHPGAKADSRLLQAFNWPVRADTGLSSCVVRNGN